MQKKRIVNGYILLCLMVMSGPVFAEEAGDKSGDKAVDETVKPVWREDFNSMPAGWKIDLDAKVAAHLRELD